MVLPIRDVNPVHRTPVVTYLLLILNVAVFLISPVALAPLLGSADVAAVCEQTAFFDRYGAKPDEVISGDQDPVGATGAVGRDPSTGAVGCVSQSPPPYDKTPFFSVLSAMFLHGGWLHLAGNMLYLYVFGNNVEDRLGRVRFLAFYLGCGVAATYGFSLVFYGSDQPLVGASGAVAGVLGAYLVLFPRARVWSLLTFFFFFPVRLPAWLVLGSWFLLQWLFTSGAGLTETTGTAYLAHVIGFALGAVLVLGLRGSGRRRDLADPRWGPHAGG